MSKPSTIVGWSGMLKTSSIRAIAPANEGLTVSKSNIV